MAPEHPITERLRQAAHTERAPAHLRARNEDHAAERSRARRRPVVIQRPAFGLSLAGALAAIVLAIVLTLPSGTPGAPSISQAATLANRPAKSAAAIDPADPSLLTAHVGSLRFPRWSELKLAGERSDRIGDRTAVTVYYRSGTRLIAYTIVSGRPLKVPYDWNPSAYTATHFNSRNLVAWREDGHTCLVSAAGLSSAALLWLAHHA